MPDDVKVEEGKIEELTADPGNTNLHTERGMGMLERSIRYRGWGRPAIADGKKRIIGGHAAIETAAGVGLEEVVYIHTKGDKVVVHVRDDLDLDERTARDMAIEDNRIGQVNLNWDYEALARMQAAGEIDLAEFWNRHEIGLVFGALGEEGDAESFDDISPTLPGAAALKDDMAFPSDEIYDIPPLLPDMLSAAPEPIDIWCGPDAADPEWDGWWFYIYGTDSIRGLDLPRSVIAFYTDDYRFDPWWFEPAKYVSRLLNAGVPIAISPNFSLYHEWPLAVRIYSVFKGRWLARYMQEAGIFIIPDVDWGVESDLDYSLAGIPKKPPCVSIQVQVLEIAEQAEQHRHILHRAIKELDPESLILYGGGETTKEAMASVLPDQLPVIWVESRVIRRQQRIMARTIAERAQRGVASPGQASGG